MVCFLLALTFAVAALGLCASPAAAQDYPNVATLQSWSVESNYMSLPGYLRWMTFREQSIWLSMAEAKRIVAAQLQQR